jgi:hypothetical protein
MGKRKSLSLTRSLRGQYRPPSIVNSALEVAAQPTVGRAIQIQTTEHTPITSVDGELHSAI